MTEWVRKKYPYKSASDLKSEIRNSLTPPEIPLDP